MSQFRSKSTVEAFEWSGHNNVELGDWAYISGAVKYLHGVVDAKVKIKGIDGDMYVEPGDYVVFDPKVGAYPLSAEEFVSKYGPLDGETASDPDWLAPILSRLGVEQDAALAREVGVSAFRVRKERLRKGISRTFKGPNKPSARPLRPWAVRIQDRLGNLPDATLAREVGVSRELVRKLRSRLAIPAKKALQRHIGSLTAEQLQWFETETNVEIAKRLDVDGAVVAKIRKEKNIPRKKNIRVHKLDPFKHLIGTRPDAQITALAGCAPSSMTQYRRSHPELPASPWTAKAPRKRK